MTKPLYPTRTAIAVSLILGSIVPICLRLHYDTVWGVLCACAAIANIAIWRVMKHRAGRSDAGSDG